MTIDRIAVLKLMLEIAEETEASTQGQPGHITAWVTVEKIKKKLVDEDRKALLHARSCE